MTVFFPKSYSVDEIFAWVNERITFDVVAAWFEVTPAIIELTIVEV